MEYNASYPIYLQVLEDIKKNIVTGRIMPGEKLASVRDMAVEYKINPNTATRVYQLLEEEGICHTRRGLGTFINEDSDMVAELKNQMAKKMIIYFLKNMWQLGFSTKEISEMVIAEGEETC